jgi:hypothetical protein
MKQQENKPISLNLQFENQIELLKYFKDFGDYLIHKLDEKDKELLMDGGDGDGGEAAHHEPKNDRRGKHMRELHRRAKEYHTQNPEMKYRECLKFISKQNTPQ